jgi:FAD/FMN-containing dehydrogenase
MSRFIKTKVDFMSGTVAVGAGLTWDQVYATLEPTGVNVIGGRITGVGVAGLTLGGGGRILLPDSWILYAIRPFIQDKSVWTSVDNVAGYELVLPNGTVINVTSSEDDLWFGLRVSG